MNTSPPLQIANDSGFPLQIAVERHVADTVRTHGWTVRYSEHSWSNAAEGASGFIDIVLQDSNETTFLVLECKRVRDADWVFLPSDGKARSTNEAKIWFSHNGNGRMIQFDWMPQPVAPASAVGHFCAIRGQSSSDKTNLLERTAAELVLATEALAFEDKDYRRDDHETLRTYFHAIVTTARLKIGRFDPAQISLADGTLQDGQFEDVPFVRFRKQLSKRPVTLTEQDGKNITDVAALKENTVFVIRAEALGSFLSQYQLIESRRGSAV